MTSWDEVRGGLKSFQVATVEAAFEGLWSDDSTSRFLVADEVGLGKTLVAKGVIARTIEKLHELGDERIDIVYICSNRAIARQNLLKLAEFADGHEESADRLTKLIAADGFDKRGVNVVALTPGTSFSFGHRTGQFDERALLYAALRWVWPEGKDVLGSAAGMHFFYRGISRGGHPERRKRLRQRASEYDDRISWDAVDEVKRLVAERNKFLQADGHPTLWKRLRSLAPWFDPRRNLSRDHVEERLAIIGEFRQILAQAGVGLLRPDLVIMDEFQRFADLLDPRSTDKAAEMLRTFISTEHFDNPAPTKVLLLSATPYRWFPRAGESSHHSDFLTTLRFLHDDDGAAVEQAEKLLSELRSAIRTGETARAEQAARNASAELRKVMVRTERLSSTPDRNGMLTEELITTEVDQCDIEGFLAAQDLSNRLESSSVIELWKTTPWLANLGDGYKLTNELESRASRLGFSWAHGSLLDIDAVSQFDSVTVPNPRLRWLIEKTVGNGWHELVWLPPCRPYYCTGNAFDRARDAGMTKQLIFSSWRVAPKAIAIGVTYAAEQALKRHISNSRTTVDDDEWGSSAYRSHDRTLLDLTLKDDAPASPTNFLVAAPFSGLARSIDPLSLGADPGGRTRPLDEVRENAAAILTEQLATIGIRPGRSAGSVEWYGYAARMLSKGDDEWWAAATIASFIDGETGGRKALQAHIESLARPTEPSGEPPSDLVSVLVDLALGSPAICALRSLFRTLDADTLSNSELLTAAARVAWGFRSLFDTPEVINVVERRSVPYWHAVLDYGVEGNLQAVMDEYCHMLREWKLGGRRTVDQATKLARSAVEALAFRTVNLDTRVPTDDGTGIRSRKMRSRFAVRFGDRSGDQDDDRKDVTSAAFNSPFWPFVMATTSIGQEGLDFHLYSHALVHWNLPRDPVTLEQREGRVHRFKGHAVRKNVAAAHRAGELAPGCDPWDAMFDEADAHSDGDGIKPYWIYEGDASVQRLVPMLPMSREQSEIEYLKRSAASYRMAFGQPRHGDLLEIVDGRAGLPSIDLSPTAADGSSQKGEANHGAIT